MEIRMIWEQSDDDGEMPWLVASVDEYTIDAHGCLPEFYAKELTGERRREMIVIVPEKVVLNLFNPVKVDCAVVEPPRAKSGDQ